MRLHWTRKFVAPMLLLIGGLTLLAAAWWVALDYFDGATAQQAESRAYSTTLIRDSRKPGIDRSDELALVALADADQARSFALENSSKGGLGPVFGSLIVSVSVAVGIVVLAAIPNAVRRRASENNCTRDELVSSMVSSEPSALAGLPSIAGQAAATATNRQDRTTLRGVLSGLIWGALWSLAISLVATRARRSNGRLGLLRQQGRESVRK
jgi:hypothetical protein